MVGDYIYIVGTVGYVNEPFRHPEGITPVYRLDTRSFAIEKVDVAGTQPASPLTARHRAKLLDGGKIEVTARMQMVAKEDGSLALAHVVQIQNDETGAWFEAFVDAHSGDVIHLTDFVAKASVRISTYWLW